MEYQGENADPTHSMDNWTIHVFGTMQIDNTRCRDAMKRYEQFCIRTVRMTPLGEHLRNTNKALDENRPRANYQKEWRRLLKRKQQPPQTEAFLVFSLSRPLLGLFISG